MQARPQLVAVLRAPRPPGDAPLPALRPLPRRLKGTVRTARCRRWFGWAPSAAQRWVASAGAETGGLVAGCLRAREERCPQRGPRPHPSIVHQRALARGACASPRALQTAHALPWVRFPSLCCTVIQHSSPKSHHCPTPLNPLLLQLLKFSVGLAYISTLALSLTGALPFPCFTSVIVAYGMAGEMVKLAEANLMSECGGAGGAARAGVGWRRACCRQSGTRPTRVDLARERRAYPQACTSRCHHARRDQPHWRGSTMGRPGQAAMAGCLRGWDMRPEAWRCKPSTAGGAP